MNKTPCRIAITPGSLGGVGPELLLLALTNFKAIKTRFLWCGNAQSLCVASRHAKINVNFIDNCHAKLDNGPLLQFFDDVLLTSPEEAQANFLKKGVELAKNHLVDALVTGPIDKACLKYLDEGNYQGQTEYFARHLTKGLPHQAFMAFMGGPFLMSLLTTHLPLRSVAKAINFDMLLQHLETVAHTSQQITQKRAQRLEHCRLGP